MIVPFCETGLKFGFVVQTGQCQEILGDFYFICMNQTELLRLPINSLKKCCKGFVYAKVLYNADPNFLKSRVHWQEPVMSLLTG